MSVQHIVSKLGDLPAPASIRGRSRAKLPNDVIDAAITSNSYVVRDPSKGSFRKGAKYPLMFPRDSEIFAKYTRNSRFEVLEWRAAFQDFGSLDIYSPVQMQEEAKDIAKEAEPKADRDTDREVAKLAENVSLKAEDFGLIQKIDVQIIFKVKAGERTFEMKKEYLAIPLSEATHADVAKVVLSDLPGLNKSYEGEELEWDIIRAHVRPTYDPLNEETFDKHYEKITFLGHNPFENCVISCIRALLSSPTSSFCEGAAQIYNHPDLLGIAEETARQKAAGLSASEYCQILKSLKEGALPPERLQFPVLASRKDIHKICKVAGITMRVYTRLGAILLAAAPDSSAATRNAYAWEVLGRAKGTVLNVICHRNNVMPANIQENCDVEIVPQEILKAQKASEAVLVYTVNSAGVSLGGVDRVFFCPDEEDQPSAYITLGAAGKYVLRKSFDPLEFSDVPAIRAMPEDIYTVKYYAREIRSRKIAASKKYACEHKQYVEALADFEKTGNGVSQHLAELHKKKALKYEEAVNFIEDIPCYKDECVNEAHLQLRYIVGPTQLAPRAFKAHYNIRPTPAPFSAAIKASEIFIGRGFTQGHSFDGTLNPVEVDKNRCYCSYPSSKYYCGFPGNGLHTARLYAEAAGKGSSYEQIKGNQHIRFVALLSYDLQTIRDPSAFRAVQELFKTCSWECLPSIVYLRLSELGATFEVDYVICAPRQDIDVLGFTREYFTEEVFKRAGVPVVGDKLLSNSIIGAAISGGLSERNMRTLEWVGFNEAHQIVRECAENDIPHTYESRLNPEVVVWDQGVEITEISLHDVNVSLKEIRRVVSQDRIIVKTLDKMYVRGRVEGGKQIHVLPENATAEALLANVYYTFQVDLTEVAPKNTGAFHFHSWILAYAALTILDKWLDLESAGFPIICYNCDALYVDTERASEIEAFLSAAGEFSDQIHGWKVATIGSMNWDAKSKYSSSAAGEFIPAGSNPPASPAPKNYPILGASGRELILGAAGVSKSYDLLVNHTPYMLMTAPTRNLRNEHIATLAKIREESPEMAAEATARGKAADYDVTTLAKYLRYSDTPDDKLFGLQEKSRREWGYRPILVVDEYTQYDSKQWELILRRHTGPIIALGDCCQTSNAIEAPRVTPEMFEAWGFTIRHRARVQPFARHSAEYGEFLDGLREFTGQEEKAIAPILAKYRPIPASVVVAAMRTGGHPNMEKALEERDLVEKQEMERRAKYRKAMAAAKKSKDNEKMDRLWEEYKADSAGRLRLEFLNKWLLDNYPLTIVSGEHARIWEFHSIARRTCKFIRVVCRGKHSDEESIRRADDPAIWYGRKCMTDEMPTRYYCYEPRLARTAYSLQGSSSKTMRYIIDYEHLLKTRGGIYTAITRAHTPEQVFTLRASLEQLEAAEFGITIPDKVIAPAPQSLQTPKPAKPKYTSSPSVPKYYWLNPNPKGASLAGHAFAAADVDAHVVRREGDGYYVFPNYEEFLRFQDSIPEQERCFHEIFREKGATKIFFDLDATREEMLPFVAGRGLRDPDTGAVIPLTCEEAFDEFLRAFQGCLKASITKYYGESASTDVIICTSEEPQNPQAKFSAHIICTGFAVKSIGEVKVFAEGLLADMRANSVQYEEWKAAEVTSGKIWGAQWLMAKKFIDMQVYRILGGLRVIGSTKPGSRRVKKIPAELNWGGAKAADTFIGNCRGLPVLLPGGKLVEAIQAKAAAAARIQTVDLTAAKTESQQRLARAMALHPDVFQGFVPAKLIGMCQTYTRVAPSYCHICEHGHDTDNTLLISFRGKSIVQKCRHHKTGYRVLLEESEFVTEQNIAAASQLQNQAAVSEK